MGEIIGFPPAGAEQNSVKDVPTHGRQGYKSGCRCKVCKNAHRIEQNEYNAQRRRDAGRTLSARMADDAGPVERVTVARINDLKLVGTEAELLIALAQTGARGVDGIVSQGKLHLLGTAQRNLLEAMDRLTALGKPPAPRGPEPGDGGEGDDFLRSLGSPEP